MAKDKATRRIDDLLVRYTELYNELTQTEQEIEECMDRVEAPHTRSNANPDLTTHAKQIASILENDLAITYNV